MVPLFWVSKTLKPSISWSVVPAGLNPSARRAIFVNESNDTTPVAIVLLFIKDVKKGRI